MQQEDSPLNRRNYLRSLFALFDAELELLKGDTIQRLKEQYQQGNAEALKHLMPLLEDYPRLEKNGRVRPVWNPSSLVSTLAYVLKMRAILNGTREDVLSDNRWGAFRKAVDLRNRITHPKPEQGLDFSAKEMQLVAAAKEWWEEAVRDKM